MRRIGVFLYVGHEVIEHPLEIQRVDGNAALALEIPDLQSKAGVRDIELRLGEKLLREKARIVRLDLHLYAGLAENEEVFEQLIRQVLQLHGLCVGGGRELLFLRAVRKAALVQQPQIADERGHRRADIVGDGGDKLGVRLPRAALAAHPLDNGAAHKVDRGGKLRKLVSAGDGYGLFKVARAYLHRFL